MSNALISKFVPLLAAGSILLGAVMPTMVGAAISDPASDFGLTDATAINVSNSGTDLKQTIANVINIALGFLGIIAVIIILYAGFKWMTAAGNEDQVGEARKMLLEAVIGMVIIFLAWIIANFVVTQLNTSVGS